MSLRDNSAASQRSRILRHHLDIMHPGMRVCELRKRGYAIETVWVDDTTPEGFSHRVGKYLLKPRRQLTIADFLAQKQNPEAAATGSGAKQDNHPDLENTLSGRLDQGISRGGQDD